MSETCSTADMACTILIVEDSEADRVTYRRYLDQSAVFGCSVLESDSGEDGLAMLQTHQPDLVLLDYLLPDIDGLEFLQTLQSAQTSLPAIIMLTGQGNE